MAAVMCKSPSLLRHRRYSEYAQASLSTPFYTIASCNSPHLRCQSCTKIEYALVEPLLVTGASGRHRRRTWQLAVFLTAIWPLEDNSTCRSWAIHLLNLQSALTQRLFGIIPPMCPWRTANLSRRVRQCCWIFQRHWACQYRYLMEERGQLHARLRLTLILRISRCW